MDDFDNLILQSIKLKKNVIALNILRNLIDVAHLVDGSGRTLLHFAAESGNCEVAKYLIESGADIDAQDSQGKTPLMLSGIRFWHIDIIDLLLDFNANIFIRDKNGKCAFHYGNLLTQIKILHKLSDIFSGDAKKIALEYVQWNKGCIYFSLHLKNTELTRLLLAHGCPLVCSECFSVFKETVLVKAVNNNDLENVKFLLDYGLDVNEESLSGSTALIAYGCRNSQLVGGHQDPEMLRLLLDRGANPTMTRARSTPIPGRMQMYMILKYSKRDIVRVLLDRKVDLYAQDANGCCAVHYMAENVHPNATEELLGRNCDVNARDNSGRTPLHYIREAHCTNVNFLLNEGAKIDAKSDQGVTPLMAIWQQRDGYGVHRQLVNPTPESWENIKRHVECLLHRGADAQAIAPTEADCFFANIADEYGFYWIQPVLVHLALIEARGTPIEPVIRDKIYQYALPREYFEKCTRQLEEMKAVKVWKSISLYELLVARDVKIEVYVRHRKLLLNLRRIKNKNQYVPYYIYVLRDRILRAVRVMSLRERIAAILCETVGLCRMSHHTIVDKIINYLGERDLRQLFREK